jgi:hypothetical protein
MDKKKITVSKINLQRTNKDPKCLKDLILKYPKWHHILNRLA